MKPQSTHLVLIACGYKGACTLSGMHPKWCLAPQVPLYFLAKQATFNNNSLSGMHPKRCLAPQVPLYSLAKQATFNNSFFCDIQPQRAARPLGAHAPPSNGTVDVL
eukprot:328708-Pelagomonas_calceolata.AAC.2